MASKTGMWRTYHWKRTAFWIWSTMPWHRCIIAQGGHLISTRQLRGHGVVVANVNHISSGLGTLFDSVSITIDFSSWTAVIRWRSGLIWFARIGMSHVV